MEQWQRYGVVAALATVGLSGTMCRAADPPTPAGTTAPPPPADTTAAPTRPQTADEKALQAYLDTIQGQMAEAVTAGHAEDYETALDRMAPAHCRFYNISGKAVSRVQYLNVERAAIAAQGSGLTEAARTQSLTITGPTALANTIVTENQDVTDATGQFGPKGRRHHWQRLTFFRIHLADAPGKKAAVRHVSANSIRPNDWKAQQVVVTDIQTFLDGNPYLPPVTGTAKRTTKPNATTHRVKTPRPRVYHAPRYIVVGPGMIIRR